MPDWLIPAICGVLVAFVLVKAFWAPPKPDPDRKHDDKEEPPGTGTYS
jgi:hypothetical protein